VLCNTPIDFKHVVSPQMLTFAHFTKEPADGLRNFAGNSRFAISVLDVGMCAIHKGLDGIKQICPNCGKSKTVRLVEPAAEQPRKHYCTECGHEWWKFDKNSCLNVDSD